MAEIKIEKKKPVWPWILVVLLLAAVIYFIFFRDNETVNEGETEIESTTGMNDVTPNKEITWSKNTSIASYQSLVNKNLEIA